ncbi:MAG TPA: TonB-dependent receptor plug domain-containing protein, partial [Bryobacteraceae bacterium]|nr:TonB-dependent receptor plug domain-containing protein [Bryobacteraceae bacterium]
MLRLKSRLLSGARSFSLGHSSTASIAARSGDGRDGKLVDYLVVAALGIGAMVASGPAMAQANANCPPDAPPSAQCPAPPGAAPSSSVETVVVTGSRIPRPEADSPSPVMSVTAQQILHSGDVNLTDYLKRIPALVGSLGDAALNVNAGAITGAHASLEGQNLLELRNLGYIRTLVLEDGQRMVATVAGTQSVDVNTIPITLIQRVDVETAGSSAIYGADAVSGVVNFIMKHDLEGIDSRFQVTVPETGGGNQYQYATSVGHNFDNGNGNVTVTYEGFYQDNVFFTSLPFLRHGIHAFEVPNPANDGGLGDIPTLPANIPLKNLTLPFIGETGFLNTLNGAFTGSGKVFDPGQFIDSQTNDAIGGDGLPLEAASFDDLQPIEHRSIAEISGDEQFNHWFKFSGEFRFVNVNTKTNEEPAFFETLITDQNPFLPASVRAALAANGTAGLGPGGSAIGLNEEFPDGIINGQDKTTRNIYRAVLGLNGDFPLPSFFHDARYDLHY